MDKLIRFALGGIFGYIFGWFVVGPCIIVAFLFVCIKWGGPTENTIQRNEANKAALHATEASIINANGRWYRTASGIPYKIEGSLLYNGQYQVIGRYPEDLGAGKSVDPNR